MFKNVFKENGENIFNLFSVLCTSVGFEINKDNDLRTNIHLFELFFLFTFKKWLYLGFKEVWVIYHYSY